MRTTPRRYGQDWIPACAESTPRIGKKCSGWNDGIKGWIPASAGMTEAQGNDGRSGMFFMSSYGAIHAVTLAPGEQLVMDTGHMVAFDATMGYHVRTVGGLKQTLFSGEGLVVDLTGPGTIYMQTRNFGAFVNYLVPKLPFKRD
ncbi:MAG TPA: AIM24 family protein [Candidatus Deferrimicrobium sp.]|nr:AIM24 family protein [Candidatus Deferrimicrobium sp.]